MYKVLMIDDDVFYSRKYKSALELLGFMVTLTSTLKDFLDQLNFTDYDAYILDIYLPDESNIFDIIDTAGGWRTGFELCKKIKSLKPNTKIVALTHANLDEKMGQFTLDNSVSYYSKLQFPPYTFALEFLRDINYYNNLTKEIYNIPVTNLIEETEKSLKSKNNSSYELKLIITKLDTIVDALNKGNQISLREKVIDFLNVSSSVASISPYIYPYIKTLVDYFKEFFI